MITDDNTAGVLQEAERLSDELLEETALDIVETAKAVVVVKSGDLRDSIDAEWINDEEIVIGSPLDYAAKIEMDQPYLRPALENAVQQAQVTRVVDRVRMERAIKRYKEGMEIR